MPGCTPADDRGQIEKFNLLARDPDQALDMLYPDGVVEPGTSTEAIRLIRDDEWTDNEFDALANMLDAAATAYRTQDDPRSELSALAATDTINLLAERETLPDTIDDSIGHIIANYIVDVNFVPWIGRIPESYDGLGDLFFIDLPPGAHFTAPSLGRVLPQVLTSEGAVEQIIDAANHFVNARVALDITGDTIQESIEVSVMQGATLLGYLLGATAIDNPDAEWSTTVANSLAATPDAIPAQGTTFADYITTQASELGQTYNPSSTPTIAANTSPNYQDTTQMFVDVATNGFINAVGIQLGQADLLEQPTDIDPLPWFVNNKFDPNIARQHPAEFEQYMSDDAGWDDTTRAIERAIRTEAKTR